MAFFPGALFADPIHYRERGFAAPVELQPPGAPPPSQPAHWTARLPASPTGQAAADAFAELPAARQACRPTTRNHRVLLAFARGRADLRTLRRVSTFAIAQCGHDWTAALDCLRAALQARDPATGVPVGGDLILFNAGLAACARSRRGAEALALFEAMLAQGIGPDAHSYTSAIAACARGGDLPSAFGLWQHLLTHGPARRVHPRTGTYNALIAGCGDARKSWEAVGLFQHLLEHGGRRGVRPDTLTYDGVIWACGRGGREDDAWRVFQHLEQDGAALGAVPDGSTFTIAHGACGRRRRHMLLEKAISAGAFKPSLGLDAASDTVDLRQRCVMAHCKAATRERSVNGNLGATIFEHLLAAGSIHPGTRFFLGNHGQDSLKGQLEQCMRNAGWTPRRLDDPADTRRWRNGGVLVGDGPRSSLNAGATEFVPSGAVAHAP